MAKRHLCGFFNKILPLTILVATFLGGFFVYAYAAREVIEVRLNGAESAVVNKGEEVSVDITVSSEEPSNWGSVRYKIGKDAWVCVDVSNHQAGTTATESFKIIAPAEAGVYQVIMKAFGGNNCKINHGSPIYKMVNGIVVRKAVADTVAPTILGLEDDSSGVISKTWSWSADEFATFRFSIDQNPNGVAKGTFSKSKTIATKSSGNGTFYLHVEAKDNAGNVTTKTVSVLMANKANMTAYNFEVALFPSWEKFQSDWSVLSPEVLWPIWKPYRDVVFANVVTENNTQAQVDQATWNISVARTEKDLKILKLLHDLGL